MGLRMWRGTRRFHQVHQLAPRLSETLVGLSPQVVANDVAYRSNTVSPRDLFALRVRPTVVGDGDLVHNARALCNLGGNLRLESEALTFNYDVLNDRPSEHLVAGLHVSEVEVGEGIRHDCQDAVAD